MANLVSTWAKNVATEPENFVMPPDKRPIELVSIGSNIPVIDISKASSRTINHAGLVQEILKASLEFGLFQIINHGIDKKLMDDVMDLFKELFDMSAEEKEPLYGEGSNKNCKIYGSRNMNYASEEGAMETYSSEMRMLELIGAGVGVELGKLELSKSQTLVMNHYLPCPDPSLAMGLPPHCDPNIITFLHQQVYGLQIFKDGHWFGVNPLPYAYVVIIGYLLQGPFVDPAGDYMVEPTKALVNGGNPALFRPSNIRSSLMILWPKKIQRRH
ncbi:hypothetical protein HAX54_049450 [Datura stramonium]|uniref:Fe2OG dioxygenase domain-containing protein n=1 Tax=Datura stramonium TaxID=4076 RepID=A0ABS8SVH6_DATST|nr:hypothetical protein [Datura stramonium]